MSLRRLSLVVAAFQLWGRTASGESVSKALRGAPGPGVEQAAFLDELEEIVGSGSRRVTELRLGDIQAALHGTFVALPKTAGGGVSASSARYAIHRLFIQLHGWYVKGLAPGGGSWSPSVPALGMADHMPERLRDLFQQRFGSDDFDLKELALIAATIESLIHGEAVGRLHASYKALGKDPEESLGKADAVEAIFKCMTTGYKISQLAAAQLETTRRSVEEALELVASGKTALQFMDVAKALEVATEQIGHRVDEGFCQAIEDRLTQMQESPNTGRVRLSDFYAHHLDSSDGDFQHFQQRPEYLRQLGTLDESDPATPRVIIPNYLLMQGNCLNVSSYYDLCCIDLCEDSLDMLERSFKSPQASPAEILGVLSGISTAYVPAGRNFSDALVKKLEEVAEHHGGTVPLHGRLFSQWMHFAYPIECAYPHLSGATKPLTYSEWFDEMGTQAMATEAEMKSIINTTQSQGASHSTSCEESEDGLCMWVAEEELVDDVNWRRVARPVTPQSTLNEGRETSMLRALACVAVIASSILLMMNFAKQSTAAFKQAQGLDASLAKVAQWQDAKFSA